VPGDIVLLEEGSLVPADCRLVEAFALRVNTATVTGESLPKARIIEPSMEESPLFAKNIALAGTSVVSGQARAMVYATGMRTEFGKIAHLTQTAGEPSSPLQREIARLSRIVAALATSMGVAMFFIGEALALGAEKPDPGVMSRPPRARSERLLSWGLITRAYLFLGALEAAASMAVFFFVLDAAGWRYGELPGKTDPLYLQATSACLAAIVVTQVANVFLCRHPLKSSLSFNLLSNPLILPGIATELGLILLIVYTPAGNWLFGTAPVGAEVWLLAAVFAAAMWLLEEARKAWLRRAARSSVN
jgi:magnesium-transporting ATPase (P-type)